MTNTTEADSPTPARTSSLRPVGFPKPPSAPDSWPDRPSRLRDQATTLNALIREDLSRGRALASLLCTGAVTLAAALVPVMVVDAASSDTSEATDVAVAAVLGVVLLALLAVPALLVLRAFRKRSVERFALLQQWAAVDRGHDAEFPTSYGAQGYPHGRFFYAAVVLAMAVILAVAVLVGLSDPTVLALLPCLIVAALFAWSAVRKYQKRYSWSEGERVMRARARRRELHRAQLAHGERTTARTPSAHLSGLRIHPALLYAALLSPTVSVTLVYVVARPKGALGLALAGLLALAVLVLGLPKVVRMNRREQTELNSVAGALAQGFAAGAVLHPVRYGLGAPDGQAIASTAAAWDLGPTRTGALAVGAVALRLRGTDGAVLDLPLAEVQGAVLLPSGVAWLAPSVDLLLRSGEAIEVRSHQAGAVVDALSGAGVQVVGRSSGPRPVSARKQATPEHRRPPPRPSLRGGSPTDRPPGD
ncbi:hypothetical protein [Streptomyces sp. NPDC047043]|uniref:hypothetical protein n=1 Tax=Streptomyces sp. NPDC047043 TaxID=3154497 RepID=UPI0034005755